MSAKVAVVGAGAWGTALALVATRAGHDTWLYGRDTAAMAALETTRKAQRALPGLTLDDGLTATADLAAALDSAVLVILSVPAQATRDVARTLAGFGITCPVMAAAKGFERGTRALMTDVLTSELPAAPALVLSGPSFADDVAAGLPTAVTVAGSALGVVDEVAARLSTPRFRIYASDDPVGVQVGGALKNVLAIACGIVEGRGLGASARAALTARGFAELSRLGAALGGRPETLMGLSGLGDLVLTCSGPQSRNFAFGLALGQGTPLETLRAPGVKLAEGVATAAVAREIAARAGREAPITDAVADVVAGTLSIDAAIDRLMSRPLKREGL
jgi:glycerol-3-phosphate dehydrogenase (NAD(P)+)